MAEEAWIEENDAPPKKRGIPGWLWFCGGGCLLLLVAAVVAVVFVAKAVKEGMDPERQWANLAEVLPYDQRGEHLQMNLGLSLVGYEFYMLEDDRGYQLLIYDLTPSQAVEFRAELFSAEFKGSSGMFGVGSIENAELGQIDLQGRMLPVQRFLQSGTGSDAPAGGPKFDSGPSAFVEVTPEGRTGGVVAMIVRPRSDETRLSDDEIRDLLAPFRIGPQYAPPAPRAPSSGPPAEAEPPSEPSGPPAEEDGK